MHQENYHASREAVRARAARSQSLELLYDIAGWTLVEQARLLEETLAVQQKAGEDDSEPWNGTDDGDFDEDDVDEGDVLPGMLVPNPETGITPNVINIFIGGADDKEGRLGNHPVLKSDSLKKDVYGKNYYATSDNKSEINKQIALIPNDTTINIIGHSWGGDTAAIIVLENPGRISTLVTVDPVSLIHPDYSLIRNSVNNWANINAIGDPNGGDISNIIAGLGRDWGTEPESFVSIFISSPFNHASFEQMMRYNFEENQSVQDILNRL
jgi:hypothetical protein